MLISRYKQTLAPVLSKFSKAKLKPKISIKGRVFLEKATGKGRNRAQRGFHQAYIQNFSACKSAVAPLTTCSTLNSKNWTEKTNHVEKCVCVKCNFYCTDKIGQNQNLQLQV